jgi:isopentenyl-diphosphate delta-isomerase
MDDKVVLVNEKDVQVGIAGKTEVHSKGLLHRAVSVFIFNSSGEILLQKRAQTKYHSAGLWSNTCCGHPLPGESAVDAALRRLNDEMGIKTNLNYLNSFIYKANLKNGLIEHELDHVFYGVSDSQPDINPEEADDWKYMIVEKFKADIEKNADSYTPWLKICIDRKILGKLI